MTQLSSFDEQAFTQLELEQYINQQAESAVKESVDYSIKCSAKSFLPNSETNFTIENEVNFTPSPERETIKHTLIGSSKAVMATIEVLQQLGYAQVSDWSPLLPSPTNPGEVMSILVKQILVQ